MSFLSDAECRKSLDYKSRDVSRVLPYRCGFFLSAYVIIKYGKPETKRSMEILFCFDLTHFSKVMPKLETPTIRFRLSFALALARLRARIRSGESISSRFFQEKRNGFTRRERRIGEKKDKFTF